jgi:hypothetical protein
MSVPIHRNRHVTDGVTFPDRPKKYSYQECYLVTSISGDVYARLTTSSSASGKSGFYF